MAAVQQQVYDSGMGETEKPVASERAPYRDIEHAIKTAYRLEHDPVCKTSSYFAQLRASELRGAPVYATPWDRHAQAVITLRIIRDNASHPDILECHYIQPRDTASYLKKWEYCRKIAQEIFRTSDGFVIYCIANWAGVKLPAYWVKRWSRIHGLARRTLYDRRRGIYNKLDDLENRMIESLQDLLQERGLVD